MIVIATAKAPHNQRVEFAMSTWTGANEVREIECTRTSADIGDSRKCYYAKDVYNEALKLKPDDIFVYLNNDVALVPEWSQIVIPHVETKGCASSNRIDILKFEHHLVLDQIIHGVKFPGKDLFAFTPAWWYQVRGEIPDVLLGYEGYDFVMWWTMLQSGAPELVPICYHEAHVPFWRKEENIHVHPGQCHNRTLCKEWAISKGAQCWLSNPAYSPYLFGSGQKNLSTSAGIFQTNLSTSAELFQ